MIKAQLFDGKTLEFPDDMPDRLIDAAVQQHIAAMRTSEVLTELRAIRSAIEKGASRVVEATTAPRETVLETDFHGRPKKSLTKIKGKA